MSAMKIVSLPMTDRCKTISRGLHNLERLDRRCFARSPSPPRLAADVFVWQERVGEIPRGGERRSINLDCGRDTPTRFGPADLSSDNDSLLKARNVATEPESFVPSRGEERKEEKISLRKSHT